MVSQQFTALVATLRARGEPFVFATVVRTVAATAAKPGAKAVVTQDGTVHGWIGGGCALGAVRRAAGRCLAEGKARLISVMPDGAEEARPEIEYARNMCPSKGTIDVFLEPVLPEPVVVVCGGSPVALALADLAPRIGLAVSVQMEPGALSPGTYVVVATQGTGDAKALLAAFRSEAPYVAFVGSRAKVEAIRAQMLEQGIPPARLAALHGPAGLPIGAVTPEEIALSILADIVRVRRAGLARSDQTHSEAAE